MKTRKERGAAIAQAGGIDRRSTNVWFVPSQTRAGRFWVVNYKDGEPTCSCPDFEKRALYCKHIFAVEIHLRRMEAPEEPAKTKYTQNWPAYNAAQMNEDTHFYELLHALCEGIQSPRPRKRGRPQTPLADIVFACVAKVYSCRSGRRATCEMRRLAELGFMEKAPHYNTISDALNNKELTPLLRKLVQESAVPLAGVETNFAIDATAFSTSVYNRWLEQKWGSKRPKGERRRAKYRKVHAVCGVITNVVTDIIVTEAGDATQFEPLLDSTRQRFDVKELSADKAYSSKDLHEIAENAGVVPYIPFKKRTRTKTGPEIWRKMFHYYINKREEFDRHYHRRSNIETSFGMIKMKFGQAIRSKNKQAQVNELYCKFLCHNICVLISSIYEMELEPKFWSQEVA